MKKILCEFNFLLYFMHIFKSNYKKDVGRKYQDYVFRTSVDCLEIFKLWVSYSDQGRELEGKDKNLWYTT